MKNIPAKSLSGLLAYFPQVEPPVTLSEEMVVTFSRHNRPIPEEFIEITLQNWEQIDEYSELIPCFRLPIDDEREFYALVYWKGALLSREYILATVSREGTLLDKKVLAGTISNNKSVVTSVAVIDEDMEIFSTVGEQPQSSQHYDPVKSEAYRFNVLPNGSIELSKEDLTTWQEKRKKRKTNNRP